MLMAVQVDRVELAPDRSLLDQITIGSMFVRYRDEIVSRKKCADKKKIVTGAPFTRWAYNPTAKAVQFGFACGR